MGLSSQEDPPVTCVTPTHLPCARSHCDLCLIKIWLQKMVRWGGEFTLGE